MSEYPEKVYVSTNVYDQHYIVPAELSGGAVEYERVDVAGYPIISKLEAQLAEAREALKCAPRPTAVYFNHEDGYERYRHWWHWTRNKALTGQGGE